MKRKGSEPLMRHLIGMESLNQDIISTLFKRAEQFLINMSKDTVSTALAGRVVVNLFFEPSTRTRNSFEIAAKRLGAIVLAPDMKQSATVKGESLIDTVHAFEALGTSIFVVRHQNNNTAQFISSELTTNACVINAGDGTNQHPTQTLLDLFTIQQNKKNFADLTVAIVGDIAHSRVARSLIMGLRIMQVPSIRLIAPPIFIPGDADALGVSTYDNLDKGLEDADVVVALRIQKERMETAEVPKPEKFLQQYGITQERLKNAKPDAIVLHPGPINRGVEIESSVADGPQSVILEQVSNGVAVRMAVMDALMC